MRANTNVVFMEQGRSTISAWYAARTVDQTTEDMAWRCQEIHVILLASPQSGLEFNTETLNRRGPKGQHLKRWGRTGVHPSFLTLILSFFSVG